MNIVHGFDSGVNNILNNYIRKPTLIKAVVQLLLMLYAVRLAPVPPPVVLRLFNNVYFKVFIFALILWTAQVSPSTSILIAVAFMITINYSTTGKIWEMMDNTVVPILPAPMQGPVQVTPEQSMKAIDILSTSAAMSVAVPPSQILPVTNIALSNITTADGASAVKALSTQSSMAVAGTPEKVAIATQIALSDVKSSASLSVPIVAPITQVTDAIQTLGSSASSSSATPPSIIIPIANLAVSTMSSASGVAAVKALAEQSILPVAGTSANVNAAVNVAISSSAPTTPTTTDTGCYPVRSYDMSKISSMKDGSDSFEDYQSFVSTPQ